MGTAIKHSVADQVKLSFVIFDIWALLTQWCSALSVGVLRCQTLQATAYPGLAQGARAL